MGLQVLGLQAARAKGSETTFDGQAMQAGTHLRWSFTPQLGFPPGAFWLLRRIAKKGEQQIPPPDAVRQAVDAPGYPTAGSSGGLTAVTQGPLGNPCTCAGCACDCCGRVATQPGAGESNDTPQYVEPTDSAALARVAPTTGRCCCCDGDPQGSTGDNGGGVGGQGGPGWSPHGPKWGPPDKEGWGLWGEPFTLPVTRANWPARYFGAPDPTTVPAPVVGARDVEECVQRLTGLSLLGGMSTNDMLAHFAHLRAECDRLVAGWPAEPNYAVPLGTSPDGANAPQLSLRLVEQLQLAALSPYLARSLGLYFVDQDAKPTVAYDYCIVGVWPQFAMPVLLSPGAAPRGALATGHALFDGMEIGADNSASHLHAWQRDDGQGAFDPTTDPGAPPEIRAAFAAATAGVPPGSWPTSMLAAQVDLPSFPWGPPPLPDAVICRIGLASPVAEVGLTLAGSGTVSALAAGTVVATANFATSTLAWQVLAAPDPVNAPIDTIELTSAAGLGSVVVVAYIATTPVADSTVGVRYALVHAPPAMKKPAPPATPVAVFRKRSAEVEVPGPTIVPRSVFDVQWVPPPPVPQSGDPVTDPISLPAPELGGRVPGATERQRPDRGGGYAAPHRGGVAADASRLTPAARPADLALHGFWSGGSDRGLPIPDGRLRSVRAAGCLQRVERCHRGRTDRRRTLHLALALLRQLPGRGRRTPAARRPHRLGRRHPVGPGGVVGQRPPDVPRHPERPTLGRRSGRHGNGDDHSGRGGLRRARAISDGLRPYQP